MPSMVLRLLTLVALVLMPFGMGAASAVPAYHASVTATAGHCDEPAGQPVKQSPDQAIDCAMACSMLATTEARLDDRARSLRVPNARPLADRDAGLHPDTATPPPKRS